MSGILAQGARFHLLGMPRNYALTLLVYFYLKGSSFTALLQPIP